MYNRYVPGHNGVYERQTVPDPPPPSEAPCTIVPERSPAEKAKQQHRPEPHRDTGLDLGDLLLLCIVILLLIDSEEEDFLPMLVMAAVLLLQQ